MYAVLAADRFLFATVIFVLALALAGLTLAFLPYVPLAIVCVAAAYGIYVVSRATVAAARVTFVFATRRDVRRSCGWWQAAHWGLTGWIERLNQRHVAWHLGNAVWSVGQVAVITWRRIWSLACVCGRGVLVVLDVVGVALICLGCVAALAAVAFLAVFAPLAAVCYAPLTTLTVVLVAMTCVAGRLAFDWLAANRSRLYARIRSATRPLARTLRPRKVQNNVQVVATAPVAAAANVASANTVETATVETAKVDVLGMVAAMTLEEVRELEAAVAARIAVLTGVPVQDDEQTSEVQSEQKPGRTFDEIFAEMVEKDAAEQALETQKAFDEALEVAGHVAPEAPREQYPAWMANEDVGVIAVEPVVEAAPSAPVAEVATVQQQQATTVLAGAGKPRATRTRKASDRTCKILGHTVDGAVQVEITERKKVDLYEVDRFDADWGTGLNWRKVAQNGKPITQDAYDCNLGDATSPPVCDCKGFIKTGKPCRHLSCSRVLLERQAV